MGAATPQTQLSALLTPNEPTASGQTITVRLLLANETGAAIDWSAPKEIEATLATDTAQARLLLRGPGASGRITAGGFVTQAYTCELPTGMVGRAILAVSGAGGIPVRGVLEIGDGKVASEAVAPPAGAPAGAGAIAADASAPPPPTPSDLGRVDSGRTFANRIGANEPVYFIYGTRAPSVKYQISFKYRLFTFHEEAGTGDTQTLQFGYTQRSLWDTAASSSPFYDTSYLPELTYDMLNLAHPYTVGPLAWSGFQVGARHESNGQAGTASRSLNVAFFRPVFSIGDLRSWHAVLFPQVFTYLGDISDNPRIKAYRGYGEVRGVFGESDGILLGFTARAGRGLEHQTYQFDLTFPVKTKILDASVFLLIQYYHGYGESLRSYDLKTESLRAGLSFVR